MASRFPEVKKALEDALGAMEAYALTHSQAPRPELEDSIIRQVQAFAQAETPAPALPEATVHPLAPESAKTSKVSQYPYWQWAAAVLLVISVFTNFFLYRQVQEKEQALVAARQLERQYVYQVSQLEQRNFQAENTLQILRDPFTQSISLKSTQENLAAVGTVYWNSESKEVFFDNSKLPAAPAGKQYQLWALADGKPIDAGLVALTSSPMQRMKEIPQAQAFAVTLEPAGGNATPTLEAMVVMGNI